MDAMLGAKVGFEALDQKSATVAPPNLSDVQALWAVYSQLVGQDMKAMRDAIVRGPNFRAEFASFTRAVVALNTMMDDPAKLADIQKLALSV